ncbi:peptidylprolyl isomerase [Falsigemmobacter intermedius]|uniref:Peptidylprolyl isomerase n=1 Tax=Falsigemmobacter intermedius TaxID=1553448 RepID=A0A444MEV7_9RHOB|nr:peptidylprolyl isomerase [Falsigemmobacter intermedius]RWY43538.1 peptidylprolyl isomerase [Falsigemmobacter intermedius]
MAKGGKAGQLFVWVLMALLIIGLSGFGVSNFGGNVRKIGSVSGEDISTTEYFRALRTDLNALSAQAGKPLSFNEAAAFGLDGAVRQRLVTQAVLDAEAKRIGISTGDQRLATEIRSNPSFSGANGQFDRGAYSGMLRDNGWTEAEFEARMRRDLARGLLQTAVVAGMPGSDVAATTFLDYIEERRSFTLVRLTAENLPEPVAAPDEAAVKAWYDANPADFTRPETRRITYIALMTDDVAKTTEVDEAELRKLYEQRLSDYVQPERRLVERLIFPDQAAADAAKARLDAGTVTFEELVTERGLTLSDIDLGDLSREDLGEAAEGVFALGAPGVAGPLPTPLGPALFRMNAVFAAEEVTFEQAKADLVSEFAQDAARRSIATRVNDLEDILAGGATLEEAAKEAGMTLGTIELNADSDEGLAAYPAFRTKALAAGERDFAHGFLLEDGSLVALRLDGIDAPALLPFEEVREQARAAAFEGAERDALKARAAEVEKALAEGADAATLGTVETHADMPRGGRIDAAPASLLADVFALQAEGDLTTVSAPEFTAVLRLDSIRKADPDSEEARLLVSTVSTQLGQDMGQDAFALLAAALETGADISLDQAAIEAVHAQMR